MEGSMQKAPQADPGLIYNVENPISTVLNSSIDADSSEKNVHIGIQTEGLNDKRPVPTPAVSRSRRAQTRVPRTPPPNGQIVEVLWEISPQGNENEDEDRLDTDWELGLSLSKVLDRNTSRVWWPARVLNCKKDQSCSLQYTRAASSWNHTDMDDIVHDGVQFFANGELKHSCGQYKGMIANWRYCIWDAEVDAGDGRTNIPLANGKVSPHFVHRDEYSSAYMDLCNRLAHVEAQLKSLIEMNHGVYVTKAANTSIFRAQVVLERTKAILRTYILSLLQSPSENRKAKRRKALEIGCLSHHDALREGFIRSERVDCTFAEFRMLAAHATEVCRQGAEVRPSFFKTSFLNLRSKETMKISFKSLGFLCQALGIHERDAEDLIYQENGMEQLRHSVCSLTLIGFSITRNRAGMSDSLILPGVGSTWVRSPSSEQVTALHRPMSKWNARESCFESLYELVKFSPSDIQKRYREAFGRASAANESNAQRDETPSTIEKFTGQGPYCRDVVPDYEDFEIVIEWNRKDHQVLSAYSSSTSGEDLLGELVCTLPCIEMKTVSLCENVTKLLREYQRSHG